LSRHLTRQSTQGCLIESSPQVEHHRWIEDERSRGLAPLDASSRELLRRMRWREPVRDRRRLWWALATVLLLHLIFAAFTWHEMQVGASREVQRVVVDDALQVRLIPATHPQALPELPVPPPLQSLPHPTTPPVVHPAPVREPSAKNAMTVSMPTPQPAPVPESAPKPTLPLFDKSGQPILAPAAASTAPAPEYVQRKPEGDTQVMEHNNPIKVQNTRFDKYFPPANESLGGAAVRNVVEKVTKPHDVRLPGGIHLKCTFLTGCQDPPPKPSAKGGDERLSMAPASPLADVPDAPKPPSESECIAIYRAGKALPQGCPIDTPTRSVDAELRERAPHATEDNGQK
jgi:hypothetical protein